MPYSSHRPPKGPAQRAFYIPAPVGSKKIKVGGQVAGYDIESVPTEMAVYLVSLWPGIRKASTAGPRTINAQQLLNLYRRQKGRCSYCGVKFSLAWKNLVKGRRRLIPSPDRISSEGTYNYENVTLACWMCNKLKGTFSESDFIDQCRRVAENNPFRG